MRNTFLGLLFLAVATVSAPQPAEAVIARDQNQGGSRQAAQILSRMLSPSMFSDWEHLKTFFANLPEDMEIGIRGYYRDFRRWFWRGGK